MKTSLPSIVLAIAFMLIANTLLLSGLISYGNDTGHWDVPYRSLASALASQGDLPLWYPAAGNGFPQLNLQWISVVFNPIGMLIAFVRPYDSLSLAFENAVWRLVGFAGAFMFARQWTSSSVGAIAVGATYVGCGVMSWAALSFNILIGQMFAPWLLTAGTIAIRATSSSQLARSAGMLGLTSGLMAWCAYPGTWLTAPVLSGPVLVALAFVHRGGMRRLLTATSLAVAIALMLVSLVLSETTSLTLIEGSIVYSRRTPALSEGLLRGVDIVGVFLTNPSYLPGISSPIVHPLYFGILSPVLLLCTLRLRKRPSILISAGGASIIALGIANFQNWTLWDHPVLGGFPTLKDFAFTSNYFIIFINILVPCIFISTFWGAGMSVDIIDKIFLAGSAWVLIVSGDNPLANVLRFNVPPFVLVRYNHSYFGLVTLLITTFAWRRIEQITQVSLGQDVVLDLIRRWGPRFFAAGSAALLVMTLVAMATPDAYGPGSPASGISATGLPHLVWQATILFVGVVTGLIALHDSKRSGTIGETRTWSVLMVTSVIAFLAACVAGVLVRRAGVHPQAVALPIYWQLGIDVAHPMFILLATAVLFARARSQTVLRAGIAAIMVLDISLAVPRYFSDNDTAGSSHPGWPYSPFEVGRSEALFRPSTSGTYKSDFPAPFTGSLSGATPISGSFSPPPPVTRLRTDWGTLYDTWVHFPSSWSPISGADVLVARDNLADSARPIGCSTTQQASPMTPTGSVSLLLATTVDVPFTADCDRLLVFTDSWAPGWSATIDGSPAPVLRVNNAIRGVMVPSGEHALQWRYRPRFLAPLLALLAAGLAISGILIAAPWWSRRFPLPHRLDRLFGFGPLPPDEIHGPLLAPLPNTPVPAISPASTDAPARDWQRLPAMWPHSLPIALPLTGFAILVLASVTAYDPRIDGPTQGFRLFLFRSVLAGLWAWIVIAGRTGFRSPVGPSLMLLVLLPPLALQIVRHTYPIQAGTPLATIATDFRSPSWQGTWEVTHRDNATIETGPSGTILRNDGATATAVTSPVRSITPDIWPWLRRPLGKIGPGPLDVAWTASLDRSGPYYTVATLGRLTIQALKNGYLVTAPVPGGDVRGDFLEVPDTRQPGPVRWLLHIEPDAGASLSLDDRQVWKGGHPGVIERITLGDASNDPEHRGSMTVTDALIVQRVALTAQ